MSYDPRLLKGKEARTRILKDVKRRVALASETRPIGRLVSISIGGEDDVAIYIKGQERAAKRVKIPFDAQFWPEDMSQDECKTKILQMNDDPDVLGIILQRPVPEHINVRSLQSAIHPLKDVEGMNPASIGNIVYDDCGLCRIN